MTKKVALLISSLFLFIITLKGQYSGFDLSRYILPDIRTSLLELNASLASSSNRNVYTAQERIEERSNTSLGSADIDYYYFRNSLKYQGSVSINANLNPTINNVFLKESTNRQRNLHTSSALNSINRFYLRNRYFIETDLQTSFLSGFDKNSRETYSALPGGPASLRKDNINDFTTSVFLPLSFGYGRIEPVEDARHALYILEELSKMGRTTTSASDDLVLEMAAEISKLKKKRFFDSRIRKIRELQVIDSFLVAKNLISASDISYFAVLNDNWDYGAGPQRESGFSINAGLNNGYIIYRYKYDVHFPSETDSHSSNKYNKYIAGGFLNVKYAKPVNLYWQASANLRTYYNKEFRRDPESPGSRVTNYDRDIFGCNASSTIQYLPNTRTSVKLLLDGFYENSAGTHLWDEQQAINYHFKINDIRFTQSLELFYYVSPRLRIQLNQNFTLIRFENQEDFDITLPDYTDFRSHGRNDLSFTMIYSFF